MGDGLRIWCLRHGESENVVSGTAGAVPHAPLTRLGRAQALRAAEELADERLAAVYAGTARRARETAEPLAAAAGVRLVAMPELVEVGIGAAEGSTDPDIRRETASVLRAWVVERDLDRRVADGESGHQVLARMSGAFDRIAERHPGGTVALVGHVASLTVALGRLCGLGSTVWGTPLPHARPFLVEWDGRHWHCPAWP